MRVSISVPIPKYRLGFFPILRKTKKHAVAVRFYLYLDRIIILCDLSVICALFKIMRILHEHNIDALSAHQIVFPRELEPLGVVF